MIKVTLKRKSSRISPICRSMVLSASAPTGSVEAKITTSRLVDFGSASTTERNHMPRQNKVKLRSKKKTVIPIGPILSGVVPVNRASVVPANTKPAAIHARVALVRFFSPVVILAITIK